MTSDPSCIDAAEVVAETFLGRQRRLLDPLIQRLAAACPQERGECLAMAQYGVERDPIARPQRVDLIRVAAWRASKGRSRMQHRLGPYEPELSMNTVRPPRANIELDWARAIELPPPN